ncbi:MAG TPA: phage tail protein [Acidimicrobiales bacterium]|nr:phage tail protein [Acidimicrobiales bacterium]
MASLADQLPACLAEDHFLRSFMGIIDEVADTVEMQVANLDHLIDVAVAPDQMVQWLGHFWLDVYLLDPSMALDRRRRWVREMGRLLWLRGTADGLTGLLGQVTGTPVEVSDSGGVYALGGAPPNPHQVRVWVEDGGLTSDDHLLATVHRELPAEVSFELHVGDRQIWPRPEEARPPPDEPLRGTVPREPALVGSEFHAHHVHHEHHEGWFHAENGRG